MRRFEIVLVAALAAFLSAEAANAASVGTVTRLRGEATAVTAGTTHPLAQNGQIELGDRIQTGPDARLEVKFTDGTVLTLGEKADFTIDELTLTPQEGIGLFTRTAGAILMAGGDIAKRPNHRIEINGNAGTIGIRGTQVWGGTIKDGSLLDVFLVEGLVEVRNAGGTVVLDKPGLGTSVTAAGSSPAAPVQWAPALRDKAIATVSFDAP